MSEIKKNTNIDFQSIKNDILNSTFIRLDDLSCEIDKFLLEDIAISLIESFELFKVSDVEYCTLKALGKANINQADIFDFIDGIRKKHINKYFNFEIVIEENSKNNLLQLGFDDVFIESILACSFKFIKLGKNKIYYESNSIKTILDFIKYVMDYRQTISVDEFKRILEEKFILSLNYEEIIKLFKDSSLYYDNTMEKLYVNKNEFIREVKDSYGVNN